jgi:hypothetical protein
MMTDNVTNVKIMPEDPGPAMIRIGTTFAVTVATAFALYYLQRKMTGPDFMVTVKMRTCRTVANLADKQVGFWQSISAKALAAYVEAPL